MKTKNSKLVIALMTIMLLIISSIPQIAMADVGDFESYDSDWGGSDWSDSDWGSSNWDYGYSYGDYGYDDSDDGGIGSVLGVIIIIIVVIVATKGPNSAQNAAKTDSLTYRERNNIRYTRSPVRSEGVANEIREKDPKFNDEQFLSWAKNLFVKLQTAWSQRDWETIRPLETEALFEQHSRQLQGYIDRKQINKMERICVNYAELVSFSQDNEKDILLVALNSSMLDYIVDEKTGAILKGSRDNRLTNTYKLTFIRKKGILTETGTGELKTTNCPNCGAPTNITSSGKCEFCNSVITTGSHDWVLADMERF